jgi:hypothetical protein
MGLALRLPPRPDRAAAGSCGADDGESYAETGQYDGPTAFAQNRIRLVTCWFSVGSGGVRVFVDQAAQDGCAVPELAHRL